MAWAVKRVPCRPINRALWTSDKTFLSDEASSKNVPFVAVPLIGVPFVAALFVAVSSC